MLGRERRQRAKTCGVRRATSSALKRIKVLQLTTRCYSSKSHNLTAGWATRPPWRVFNRVFVGHGRKAVLKPQGWHEGRAAAVPAPVPVHPRAAAVPLPRKEAANCRGQF
jgi:hypothetical protein